MKLYFVRILDKTGGLGDPTYYTDLDKALDGIIQVINAGAFSGVYLYEAEPRTIFTYVNPKLGPE